MDLMKAFLGIATGNPEYLGRPNSDPFADGTGLSLVAGVDGPSGLEQQEMALTFGVRFVLEAPRHHAQLALVERHRAVPEIDAQLTGKHQEELVGVIVAVPHEITLNLDEFDLGVVHLRHDLGRPVTTEEGQFVVQVDNPRQAHLASIVASTRATTMATTTSGLGIAPGR